MNNKIENKSNETEKLSKDTNIQTYYLASHSNQWLPTHMGKTVKHRMCITQDTFISERAYSVVFIYHDDIYYLELH